VLFGLYNSLKKYGIADLSRLTMNKRLIFFLAVGISGILIVTAYLGRKVSNNIMSEFKNVDSSIVLSIGKNDSADFFYRKLETTLKPDEVEKIKELKKAVSGYNSYIDSIKSVFSQKSAGSENITVTNQYFEKEKIGEELFLRRTELAGVMSYVAISDSVKQAVTSINQSYNGQMFPGPAEFTKEYFHNSPPAGALTILAFLHLDINRLEMDILKEYSNLAESGKIKK
jgi:hypothetical protein